MSALKQLIGIVSEKNLNFEFVSCNSKFLEYSGLKTKESVIGITDYEMPWSHYADLYRAHEEDALAGKYYSTIIPMTIYNGETRLFLHTKLPKLTEDKQVCGIVCGAVEILNADIYKLGSAITVEKKHSEEHAYLQKFMHNLTLSQRQKEVLFFLIQSKSSKWIANALHISARTVEYYIEIMKNKFNCHTREELTELIINNDLSTYLSLNLDLKELLEKLK